MKLLPTYQILHMFKKRTTIKFDKKQTKINKHFLESCYGEAASSAILSSSCCRQINANTIAILTSIDYKISASVERYGLRRTRDYRERLAIVMINQV